MIYISINENNGKWFGETNDGKFVELTHIPRSLKAEHLIDLQGNVVAKRCTRCGEMTLATREYFRADRRRFAGLQQKCKKCHSEWDVINRTGESINGGPKKTQKARAKRNYNEAGLCVEKECLICRNIKMREEFPKHQHNHDGLSEYCKGCVTDLTSSFKVEYQNRRAVDNGLPGTLTESEWKYIVLDIFDGKCALTGEETDVTFEHMMPLSSRQGGTVAWNNYPINLRLNCSKGASNFFEWIEKPHIKAQLSPIRVRKLVGHLADQCGMTINEYKEFYNWMYNNNGPSFVETGLSSLEYYKKFIQSYAS